MKPKLKIAIAEDHVIFRQLLINYLRELQEIEILIEASNGEELISQLAGTNPELIILDLQMPKIDGWKVLSYVKAHHPTIGVLVLTYAADQFTIADVFRNGANGWLCKDCCLSNLTDAILDIKHNGFYYKNLSQELQTQLKLFKRRNLKLKLSNREIETLRLVMKNHGKQEIANTLNISTRTVEWHKSNILAKTQCHSIEEIKKWSTIKLLEYM